MVEHWSLMDRMIIFLSMMRVHWILLMNLRCRHGYTKEPQVVHEETL